MNTATLSPHPCLISHLKPFTYTFNKTLSHFENGRGVTAYFMLDRNKTRALLSLRLKIHPSLQKGMDEMPARILRHVHSQSKINVLFFPPHHVSFLNKLPFKQSTSTPKWNKMKQFWHKWTTEDLIINVLLIETEETNCMMKHFPGISQSINQSVSHLYSVLRHWKQYKQLHICFLNS